MKKNEWNEGLDHLDPEIVEKYIEQKDRIKAKDRILWEFWLRLGAIAACCVLLISAVIFVPMLPGGGAVWIPESDTLAPDDPADGTADTDAPDPPRSLWADVSSFFAASDGGTITSPTEAVEISFFEIKSSEYSAYKKNGPAISDEIVGKKIATITVRTGWRQLWNGNEHSVREVSAEVYEIINVKAQAAVAVKYLEKPVSDSTDFYYVYVNSYCEANSIEDFLNMYNAKEHMSVKSDPHLINVQITTFDGETGRKENYRTNGDSLNEIRECILNLTSTETLRACSESELTAVGNVMSACRQRIRLTVNIKTGGDVSVHIMDNGYVCFGGNNEFFALYFVGEEAAQNLSDLIKNNSEPVNIPSQGEGSENLDDDDSAAQTTAAPAYIPK